MNPPIRVFLTGATGTIGSALVPQLLQDAGTQVWLLIRARDSADLADRFGRMLGFWGWPPDAEPAARLHPVRGDVSREGLGLDAGIYADLVATVSHVVHAAASVKLNMPMAEALNSAVTPTREVLRFARRAADKGGLRKIDLISTVGVWGRTPGVLPEAPLQGVASFHNTYEAAKYQAEQLLYADAGGLPFTLHRPSMVVGESRTGRVVHFQVFYHLCEFLSGSRTFGVMPSLGTQRLDTVPVDWVAGAIRWAMQHPDAVGRVLHLCSGPQQSIELVPLQRLVRQLWQEQGRKLPRLITLPSGLLRGAIPLIGLLSGAAGRRALKGLPPVLEYLAEDQGFANHATLDLLQRHGLPLPEPQSYLQAVLRHYLDTRRQREPA